MSIAPANKASMAAGPALKVFHSIFTPGPNAFSKNPVAFPTIAWECVMLGNAPTRIVVTFPCAQLETDMASDNANPTKQKNCLFTLFGLQRPWGGRWPIPFSSFGAGAFSLLCKSVEPDRRSNRPELFCRGYGLLRRKSPERPDKARGAADPYQSGRAIARHPRKEPARRQSAG